MEPVLVQSPAPARSRRPAAAPKRGNERVRLEAEISALGDRIPDEEGFRQAAVGVVAAALQEGRAEAQRLLEEGGKGIACASQISELEDEIIVAIHDLAQRTVPNVKAPVAGMVTILAVGG